MDIKDFKEAKRRMELDINSAINEAIGKFQIKTGYTPNDISLNIVNITTHGDPKKVWRVADVLTDVEL